MYNVSYFVPYYILYLSTKWHHLLGPKTSKQDYEYTSTVLVLLQTGRQQHSSIAFFGNPTALGVVGTLLECLSRQVEKKKKRDASNIKHHVLAAGHLFSFFLTCWLVDLIVYHVPPLTNNNCVLLV